MGMWVNLRVMQNHHKVNKKGSKRGGSSYKRIGKEKSEKRNTLDFSENLIGGHL